VTIKELDAAIMALGHDTAHALGAWIDNLDVGVVAAVVGSAWFIFWLIGLNAEKINREETERTLRQRALAGLEGEPY
jgi:hypothetical protein